MHTTHLKTNNKKKTPIGQLIILALAGSNLQHYHYIVAQIANSSQRLFIIPNEKTSEAKFSI